MATKKSFKERMMERTLGKDAVRKITYKHIDAKRDRSWSPEEHERLLKQQRSNQEEG
jgi:hypothetical protein